MNCRTALIRRLVILGILSLVLLAGCGGGTAPAVINHPPGVTPQATGVTVSPASVTVQTGGAQPFAVIVSPSGANQAVTWSVSGTGCAGANCGKISSVGMYTAPASVPNPAIVTVTATSVTDSTKFGSATVTIVSPPPPATPTSTLLIQATPPAGVTVLSFSMTVTGAVLEPGAVPLVTNPISIEINRLQVETSLLASLTTPSGTYSSLTMTLANPSLTILNNSGAAVGPCASGAICKLSPTLVASSVNLTGQPFPVTNDGTNPFVLLLDFDLFKSLSFSNPQSLNPVVTVQQLMLGGLDHGPFVRQVDGNIIYTAGDFVDGAIFDLVTNVGTLHSISDSFAQYVDGTLCGYVFCVQDKIADVDLTLPSRSDSFWEARRVTLKPLDQPELEGVIVAIADGTQFDIVLLHQVPPAAGLELGDVVRINLPPSSTVQAVDTDLTGTGLLFSAASDLLMGQVVTVRAQSAPSGTPVAVTTDRVRLKSGALTAQVKSILNTTDFVVDSLPGNFSSGQIQVRANAQTSFLGISGAGGLKAGDTVSISGFLLKATGDPVLLAEGIRKR